MNQVLRLKSVMHYLTRNTKFSGTTLYCHHRKVYALMYIRFIDYIHTHNTPFTIFQSC